MLKWKDANFQSNQILSFAWQKDLLCINKYLTKFKRLGVQITLFEPTFMYCVMELSLNIYRCGHYISIIHTILGDLFTVDIEWTKEQDHAGFYFNLRLMGLFISFTISDTRHWDDDEDCWEKCF